MGLECKRRGAARQCSRERTQPSSPDGGRWRTSTREASLPGALRGCGGEIWMKQMGKKDVSQWQQQKLRAGGRGRVRVQEGAR
eukprot:1680512-Rhodomonas_salina.1